MKAANAKENPNSSGDIHINIEVDTINEILSEKIENQAEE